MKSLVMEDTVTVDRLNKSRMWISSSPKGQFLEFGKNQSMNYLIFNALGNVELEGSLQGKRKIDIQTLSRGIYFIQFLLGDKTNVTRQFMKI